MTNLAAATNLAARPLWKLAVLLAACPTVQTLFGVTTPAAAFERIYWPWASDSEDEDGQPEDHRPRIILEELDWDTSDVTERDWLLGGAIAMSIELPAAETTGYWASSLWPESFWPESFWATAAVHPRDQLIGALNVVGGILRDLMRLRGTPPTPDDVPDPNGESHLTMKRLRLIEPTGFVDSRRKQGAYYLAAVYRVEWRG